MALDTRDKRSSAIGVTLPWRGMFPAPDGAISAGDRQQTAFVYRGVLAGEAEAPPGYGWLEYAATGRMHYEIQPGKMHYAATPEDA